MPFHLHSNGKYKMKEVISITAMKRMSFGTSASRKLRLQNKIPATIYCHKEENKNITLDEHEINKVFKKNKIFSSILNLSINGEKNKVLIKDIQRHQYKNKFLHIDFQKVEDNSKISTKIPIIFLNKKQCVGVKYGGRMSIKMVDVDILCEAKNLPENIIVDLSTLEINQSLHLSDIKGNNKIQFVDEKKGFNRIVVSIKKPKKSSLDKAETSNTDSTNKIENAQDKQ